MGGPWGDGGEVGKDQINPSVCPELCTQERHQHVSWLSWWRQEDTEQGTGREKDLKHLPQITQGGTIVCATVPFRANTF